MPPVVVAGTALYVDPVIATGTAVAEVDGVGGAVGRPAGGVGLPVAEPQALATTTTAMSTPIRRLRIQAAP